MFLLKFRSEELVGCRIKFRIQRVPTQHTFDRPRYPKNKKYLKQRDDVFCTPGTSPQKVPERYMEVTYNSPLLDAHAFDQQTVDSVGFMMWDFH